MTYNQFITEITTLLQSHAMIKEVRNMAPQEWLFKDRNPEYPIALFDVLSGTAGRGGEQVWQVQFFFLDKSGAEQEFEQEVISDQWAIAEDIISLIRPGSTFGIDDTVTITAISDKYEDYLAGATMTLNLTTYRSTTGCDIPTA